MKNGLNFEMATKII